MFSTVGTLQARHAYFELWGRSILLFEMHLNEKSCISNITHSWRENNWSHTFPKGINAMWNAIGIMYIYVSVYFFNLQK